MSALYLVENVVNLQGPSGDVDGEVAGDVGGEDGGHDVQLRQEENREFDPLGQEQVGLGGDGGCKSSL